MLSKGMFDFTLEYGRNSRPIDVLITTGCVEHGLSVRHIGGCDSGVLNRAGFMQVYPDVVADVSNVFSNLNPAFCCK